MGSQRAVKLTNAKIATVIVVFHLMNGYAW